MVSCTISEQWIVLPSTLNVNLVILQASTKWWIVHAFVFVKPTVQDSKLWQ